jgi:hypothetical protein
MDEKFKSLINGFMIKKAMILITTYKLGDLTFMVLQK